MTVRARLAIYLVGTNLIFHPAATDLEKLAYDISRSWYVPVLWLRIVFSVG
jgi:hypothetical protein